MAIEYDAKYFSPRDTLECGQIFRFAPYREGYKVFSADRACYVYSRGNTTYIECDDEEYFYDFFDLARDYEAINARARAFGVPLLSLGAERGAGLRLLNQNAEEMIFSFIVSQNNNIPRIRGILNRLCRRLGSAPCGLPARLCPPEPAFSFPAPQRLRRREALQGLGLGYREGYVAEAAAAFCGARAPLRTLSLMSREEARQALLSLRGVGPKVADCILLFGLGHLDAFPRDVWINRILQREFPEGFPLSRYDGFAGLLQQMLFFYERRQCGLVPDGEGKTPGTAEG